jgi:hypothetical protein
VVGQEVGVGHGSVGVRAERVGPHPASD